MLKSVTDYRDLGCLAPSPYSARIQALFKTYGNNHRFTDFWIQNRDTAVCRIDGNLTIECGENTDYDELKQFLNYIPFRTVLLDERILKNVDVGAPVKLLHERPVGVGRNKIVGVNKCDVVALGYVDAGIPGIAQSSILLVNNTESGIALRPDITNGRTIVGRTVVNKNGLPVGERLFHNALEASLKRVLNTIDGDDDTQGHNTII